MYYVIWQSLNKSCTTIYILLHWSQWSVPSPLQDHNCLQVIVTQSASIHVKVRLCRLTGSILKLEGCREGSGFHLGREGGGGGGGGGRNYRSFVIFWGKE